MVYIPIKQSLNQIRIVASFKFETFQVGGWKILIKEEVFFSDYDSLFFFFSVTSLSSSHFISYIYPANFIETPRRKNEYEKESLFW